MVKMQRITRHKRWSEPPTRTGKELQQGENAPALTLGKDTVSDQHHLFTASRFPTPSVREEHCFLINILLRQTLQSHSKKITH